MRAIGQGVAIGSGGSRLLRDNDPEHVAPEQGSAAFRQRLHLFFDRLSRECSAAGHIAKLPPRGDLIVHDTLVYTSAHEGIGLSRTLAVPAVHNDVQSFDDAIATWRKRGGTGAVWIAIESLYSIDGDRAPLVDLAVIATHHNAVLLIDEAHPTGYSVRTDGASLPVSRDATTSSRCGPAARRWIAKTLVCGPQVVRNFLINRGREFIFRPLHLR